VKVLIVATNRERSPFPVAPLGALCVAGAAAGAGHDVDVLDMSFARLPRRRLRAALARGAYDVVGFSIRNHDNGLYVRHESYLDGVRRLAEEVQRRTNVPLVLGGSGFSMSPRGWLRRLGAPYGVVAEGERPFLALLERLESGAPINGVPGVLRRGQAQPDPEPVREPDLDTIPRPAHDQCDYRRYLARGGFVGIQTKRGCALNCIYCTYPALEGRVYRLRAPESVADEIEHVQRAIGAKAFFFTDSVFNVPREQALAVCRELARRRLTVRWMAYCNPIGFDRELALAMTEAGCIGVEFGCDGATDKMLAALGKGFTTADIRACLDATAHADLPAAVHLLFGGPGETIKDIQETQEFLDSCARPNAVFASFGIRVYEGTPLAKLARSEGVIAPDADLFEPAYYLSETLGKNPLRALDAIARRRPEWSTPTDWTGLILPIAQSLTNRFGVRPQWRDARNYGKYMRW